MKMDYKFEEDMEMRAADTDKKDSHDKHYKQNKIMTMEDVSKQLSEDFEEEIEDCKKYLCMAHIAERANDHEDCHYLLEMSKDEYTHAYFIYTFMCEHNIHIPEEHEREFMELKEKMKEFF